MITDLAIYQKVYDLYIYTHRFILKMPKSQRFLMSKTLQESLMETIKLMVVANLQRDKTERLLLQEQIEGWMMIYLTTLRLARDLKMLADKKYECASILSAEILKILAGWKKC